jgi:acetyl esterase/lipase
VPPESAYRLAGGVAAGTTTLHNVSTPTLSVYRPEPGEANGDSVVICPGGGWKLLFWENEGVVVAQWFTRRGYTAFVLKYRLEATPEDPAEFAAC